jgi:quinol monooxygenase YgiN
MTVEYIRYELGAHQAEEFVNAYTTAADALRAAPECMSFELTQCEEAPRSFILRIEWKSTAAHLEGFRKGPHFPPFLAAIKPFIGEIAEMRHYSPTSVVFTRP